MYSAWPILERLINRNRDQEVPGFLRSTHDELRHTSMGSIGARILETWGRIMAQSSTAFVGDALIGNYQQQKRSGALILIQIGIEGGQGNCRRGNED